METKKKMLKSGWRSVAAAVALSVCLVIIAACNSNIDKALKLSESNRNELEKVLDHFKNSSDPLRYKAARFLIENMPTQYYEAGSSVDAFDSIYLETSKESQNNRTKFLESMLFAKDMSRVSIVYDISCMKADYLIKRINEACDAWEQSTWHTVYDDDVFLEYVLPYKLNNEPISDWHATISDEFPLLSRDVVFSRRGQQLDAKDAQCVNCETKECVGASNKEVRILFSRKSSITFTVNTERETEKRLILKYSSAAHAVNASVRVNGRLVKTINLVPTRNMETFVDKWFNFSLPLKKGKNSVSILSPTDTICVDYIQLGAIERFKHDDVHDFSTNYYNIENVESRMCISYDTLTSFRYKTIFLKPYNMTDSTQLLRLDYAGYPLWRIGYYKSENTDMCLQMEFGVANTLASNAPVTPAKYVKRPFDQWLFMPLGNDIYRIMNKHTGMFLDTYRNTVTGKEILVQKPFSNSLSQKWLLRMRGKNLYRDSFFRKGSAISEAMRIFDFTHQFEYYIYNSPFATNPSLLYKAKSGKCADETSFSIYLCRYLGIPSAYDFTPHWGNRSSSHSWSVLINEEGKSTPFYMGNFPGDTAHYFHSYIKPKVFRYRYSLNKEIVRDMSKETSIPRLFLNPHFTDVTDEYCETSDVELPVPTEYKANRIAYICVFDNRTWVPVHYGRIRNGKVTFKAMGRGIAYMAGIYKDGVIVPFGNPFVLTKEGTLRVVKLNYQRKINLKLLRKYPFMGAQDFFNSRMNGGLFQGANKENFSDAVTLYKHRGITNGNWYTIPVKENRTFKYLRYMGSKGSFCNINELEFYSPDGSKMSGTIIGTEGESWARKETVFDGNILTGFGGKSPDGNWVGLSLSKATQVSKIRYIGRNDGNGIEVGDVYELYCWNPQGHWQLLGTKKANDNVLTFYNIPLGGLYILRDKTKGSEERIFTYEGNRQVWW